VESSTYPGISLDTETLGKYNLITFSDRILRQGGSGMANTPGKSKRKTYTKQAKENKLDITLKELDIDPASYQFDRSRKLDELFCNLTVYTPTMQSHYGEKFSAFPRLTQRELDGFLGRVFSALGVKKVYLYETYSDRTKNKTDLYDDVVNETGTMLCLRCDSGVKESLYMAVRNAIAHGNIVRRGDYYELYSVSDQTKEYDSNVTFFLRIKKLEKLKALITILDNYR
jgi:hypothetical protein